MTSSAQAAPVYTHLSTAVHSPYQNFNGVQSPSSSFSSPSSSWELQNHQQYENFFSTANMLPGVMHTQQVPTNRFITPTSAAKPMDTLGFTSVSLPTFMPINSDSTLMCLQNPFVPMTSNEGTLNNDHHPQLKVKVTPESESQQQYGSSITQHYPNGVQLIVQNISSPSAQYAQHFSAKVQMVTPQKTLVSLAKTPANTTSSSSNSSFSHLAVKSVPLQTFKENTSKRLNSTEIATQQQQESHHLYINQNNHHPHQNVNHHQSKVPTQLQSQKPLTELASSNNSTTNSQTCQHCKEVACKCTSKVLPTLPHQCLICETVFFAREKELAMHMQRHSGARPHLCTICDKAFLKKCDLLRHRQIHANRRLFKCEHCDRSFNDKSNLRGHLKRQHPQ